MENILPLGEPGVLVGDGTMPYPGNSRVLEAPEVAETVKETKLGKTRLLIGEAAVPGTSDLLERVAEGIEIDGCDKEKMIRDGKEETADSAGELDDTAGLLGGATHLVQSVDVVVRVTVEMVVVISSNDVLPEVTRVVTGQVVKVV